MKSKLKVLLLIFLLGSFASTVFAGGVKFSGYVFGDYYLVALNNNPAVNQMHGFWIRRVYFTADFALLEQLSARIRFELNSTDFTKPKAKLMPFIKDVYLKWKVKKGHAIFIGLSPTPTWSVVEKHWGYRSVEKTPLDLAKFGSSRDLGLAAKGSFLEGKVIRYHIMFANGAGTSSETNAEKKFLIALGIAPTDLIIIEFYGDYELGAGHTDKYTLQAFMGVKNGIGRAGVLFTYQHRQGTPDLNLELLSAYVVLNIVDKLRGYIRVDRSFDPNPSGSKIAYIPFNTTARSTFFLVGVDFEPWKNVHFMPNVETIFYDMPGGGVNPSTDLIARMTFYYKFSG